jgi:BASS family bile acid:Na+ symporter
MQTLLLRFYKLLQSYLFILLLAFFGGFFLQGYAESLATYAPLFLGLIFFLSALKIDLSELWKYKNEMTFIVGVNALMLLIFPGIVYFVTLLFAPSLAIPFMILAAMPCGMTSPLMVEICGGKQSLALVLTISSSLLAPFTIPLVIKLLAGTSVAVSFASMFLSLVKVIFIPFVLAEVVKRAFKRSVKASLFTFKPISLLLLGLLIMGIIGKQTDVLSEIFHIRFLVMIFALYLLFVFFHLAGYYSVFWRKSQEKATVMLCLAYMNFTLAIYLVSQFFPSPEIAIPVTLSVIPWSTLVPVAKYVLQKKKIV